jgi:predicted MPP superfamily phosphohydrolase
MIKRMLSTRLGRRGPVGAGPRLRLRLRWQEYFAAVLQAAMIEPRTLEVTHQPITIPHLPAEFHGFRLVQLSDIHHSPFLGEHEIAAAADHANSLDPDLIVLTGDYVSHSRDFITGCARALGRLRARHGVVAVLGNHDHWTDGTGMARALRDHGIRVLENENLLIERGASAIRLIGVDDSTVRRDDLPLALQGTSRIEARILLAHNPAIIREAARAGIDLVLSGHTHGGQINWRLLIGRDNRQTQRWLRRPSRRLMRGYARLGETQLYVNRGLGTVVLPLRYGCPPEITVIELAGH